jgi:hypothetical protein
MSGKAIHPSITCAECNDYLARRETVLPAAVVESAKRRGLDPKELFLTYMLGVHDRHLSGLSLAVSA